MTVFKNFCLFLFYFLVIIRPSHAETFNCSKISHNYWKQQGKNEKDFAKNQNAGFYVRINSFSDSSIDMLVQAFTVTNDWGEFLKIKENLAVQIIEIVENNSAAFAFPSQSLYLESLPIDKPEIFNPKTSK